MKTRLRYSNVNNTLVATDLVSNIHNDTLTVVLVPETLTATILTSEKHVVWSQTSPSLPELKRVTKKALTQHGVVFLDELRKRKTNQEQAA